MDDKTLQMAMLLDFFGELLTNKQREYFDLYYNENLSLAEIAEQYGITRQGVYDIVTRAERALLTLEEKTGVVKRWSELQSGVEDAFRRAEALTERLTPESEARRTADSLLDALISLKGKV